LSHIRTFFAICAIAIPAGALISGCGGDDESSDEDPQAVLEETFNNEERITSGNLSLSASVSASGEQGGSFEASLAGPFQGDPEDENAIPQLDWSGSVSGEGAGDSIDYEAGLVVTDDNAFVEYGGEAYEVGSDQFTQLKDQVEAQAPDDDGDGGQASFQAGCEQALQQAGATDTSACEIDLESWLTNLTNEGTEDVGGSESVHIRGDADVDQILADIGELASAVPGAAASGFDPSQLGSFSGAVTEAAIDVYSTADEHLLSKLELALAIDPSVIAGGAAVPVDSIDVDFSIEIAEINEEQTIEGPSDAKPISELLGGLDIGGLGPLGGAIPGGAGGGGIEDPTAYLECLDQAQTPEEIDACGK
jgi:hypothetical protein